MRVTQLSKVAAWSAYERYAESIAMLSPAACHAARMSARSSTSTARTSFDAEAPANPASEAGTRSSGA
jgi:hypothetical protein